MGHILTGVRLDETETTAVHALGSLYTDENGRTFVYLVADEAITGPGYAVVVEQDWGSQMVDTTSTANHIGAKVAFAYVAVASGSYYWAQCGGAVTADETAGAEKSGIRVAASAAAGAALNSTATGGVLDDDGTVGAESILGVYISETDGGTGGVVDGFLCNPHVGLTL